MRFRNGIINRVGASVTTTATGSFSNTLANGDGLVLRTLSGSGVANINEKTGVISLSGSGLQISAIGANADHPLQIQIQEGQKILYTQSFALGSKSKILQV